MTESEPPSIGLCAQVACILDVMSNKPGNVSAHTPSYDMTAVDFLFSAAAIVPVLQQAPYRPVGQTILDCIIETRKVTTANTNLGIVLLLAPLASVPSHLDLRGGLMRALIRLDVDDARATYQAIRLARPGGLGKVDDQDVSSEPTVTLREAMALAADRDLIARQYVNDFEQVFEGAESLRDLVRPTDVQLERAVTWLHLQLLAKNTDSLIARKLGPAVAEEVSRRAREIMQVPPGYVALAIQRFDEWLRRPGTRTWNPGTTADLVVASLFVALRRGIIQLPLPRPSADPPPG